MFIGWTYQKWDKGKFAEEGIERDNFMNSHMPGWIVHAIGDTR